MSDSAISWAIELEKKVIELENEITFLRECLSSFEKDDKNKLFEKLDSIRVERDEWHFRYNKISEDLAVLCSDILLINHSFVNNSTNLQSDVKQAMEDITEIDARIKTDCY